MIATTRKLRAVGEFAACMGAPLWLTSQGLGLAFTAMGTSYPVLLLPPLAGVVAIGGVLWALVCELSGQGPPGGAARLVMGAMVGGGCALAVLFGTAALVAVADEPSLQNIALALFGFWLPLLHGVRRLGWLLGRGSAPLRAGEDRHA